MSVTHRSQNNFPCLSGRFEVDRVGTAGFLKAIVGCCGV